MGTLSSGVGLVSGLDYQSIVNQLIAIDARPRDLIVQRMGRIDAQRTAYLDISARIKAVLSNVAALRKPSTFRAASVTSSAENVLTATAGSNPVPGSYRFVVQSLASTHQSVSTGFTSRTAPLGGASFTIESAAARVNRPTRLDELNGFAGVPRGRITLEDRTGRTATVDLSGSLTLNEVVDAINAADVGIDASLADDGLRLTDTTTGTGALRIRDEAGGAIVAALGFDAANQATTANALNGRSLLTLSNRTPLSALRDGLGVRSGRTGADFVVNVDNVEFAVDLSGILKPDTRIARLNQGAGAQLGVVRITTRNEVATEVDLSGAQTISEVQQRLQTVPGLRVTVADNGLVVTDETVVDEDEEASAGLVIEDVSGFGARDLGIAGTSDAETAKITGRQIITNDTVGDVLAAINHAVGNEEQHVLAEIAPDGRRLQLTAAQGGVIALSADRPNALADIGFAEGRSTDRVFTGQRILGGANSVLLSTLNGGRGVSGTTLAIGAGATNFNVDIAGAETLGNVIDRIRAAATAAGANIEIGTNANGTALELRSLAPDAALTVGGDAAAGLGLSGTGALIRGANLQKRYVNENSLLADLNNGRGVSLGRMKIINSQGQSATLDLVSERPENLQDVIDAVAELGIGVRAQINANGDGLEIIDEAGGAGTLRISDENGTAGRDLNILGTASSVAGAPPRIDGSFEFRIQLGANGSLNDLAREIGETTIANAGILNDGSPFAPYRLSIASRTSGLAGALLIESDAASGVTFSTLTQARDARVVVGSDAATGLVLTSGSNTIENAVGGLTLELQSASDDPVTLDVDQNYETAITAMKALIDGLNGAVDQIKTVSSFNSETEARGSLLGESAPREAQRRLLNLFTRSIPNATGTIRRMSDLGFKLESGTKITLDETKFKEAYDANPEAVTAFFTAEDATGQYFDEQIKQITDPDGLIDRRTDTLESSKTSMQSRVDQINERLDRKRARLLRQFQNMEQTLSLLQGQQASLGSFGGGAPQIRR
ncbi:MAG: flagellar filament capping protein FliD [Phycisphaerae bacterium]|nr:flagellar filament capping protein FliD [Phycisphaerae bacterium]